jgi:hypothetical protein
MKFTYMSSKSTKPSKSRYKIRNWKASNSNLFPTFALRISIYNFENTDKSKHKHIKHFSWSEF